MPTPATPERDAMPTETDDLEATVDRIIADCGGNQRDAIRALVIGTGFLERELERVRAEVSSGYVRGRYDLLAHADKPASGHSGDR